MEQETTSTKDKKAELINQLVNSIKAHHDYQELTQRVVAFIGGDINEVNRLPEDIQTLVAELESLVADKGQEKINEFKQLIMKNINTPKENYEENHQRPELWEAANILLQLKSLRDLSPQLLSKMTSIILTGEPSELTQLFQDLFKDQINLREAVNKQLSKISLKGRPVHNLKTLILQIFKTKPKEMSLYEKLLNNRNNTTVFHGQSLQIADQKANVVVRGIIKQTHYEEPTFYFRIVHENKIEDVKLSYSNGGYINCVRFQAEKVTTLRQYLSGSYSFERTVYLEHSDNFNSSTIVPAGQCVLRKIVEEGRIQGYLVEFMLREKLYQYEIIFDENGQPKQVKYLEKQQNYTYNEFVQGYFIKEILQKEIRYNNREISERSIKIKKGVQKGKDTIQIIETINSKKNHVIGQLLSLNEFTFDKLLKRLIYEEEIQTEDLKGIDIHQDIDEIIHLSKEVGRVCTEQEVMKELLTDVNYASLVSKEKIMSSIRTVELFAQSESYAKTMKNRDIVAFYGNTGSGKSTSINYFLRVPLKKTVNSFGDNVVEVNKQNELKQLETNCKIGQSNGISETLYSQGFAIPKEKYQQCDSEELKQIILCDNPGFNDTRGTAYEICTNLTMDRAIETCRSIKAIVLVLPYPSIDLDRSNHLISLINLMEERFPNLLNHKSSVFSRFFILISKSTLDYQNTDNLAQKFVQMAEEYKRIAKTSSNDKLGLQFIRRRTHIFNTLKLMCETDKINLIDISDYIERDLFLEKYVCTSVSIPKNQYVRALENNQITKQFCNQISVSAHTWTKLVLSPFFQAIPESLSAIKEKILQIEQKIINQISQASQIDAEMSKQNKVSEENEKKLQLYRKEQERLEKQNFTEQQIKLLQNQDMDIVIPEFVDDEFQSQMTHYHSKIQKQKQRIQDNQKSIEKAQDEITDLQSERRQKIELIKQNTQKIKKWKTGRSKQIVYTENCKLGGTMWFGKSRFTLEQRLELIQKGEELPSSETEGSFIIGQQLKQLCNIIKIERSYNLLPSKQFDPNSYITKCKSIYGKYDAHIKSQGYALQGANLMEDGKKMLLSVLTTYPVTNDKSMLPFMEITHTIPNQEQFSASIKNTDAQNRNILPRLTEITKLINENTKKIDKYQCEIQQSAYLVDSMNKNIEKLTEENEKAKQNRKKQMKAQNRSQKIIFLKEQNTLRINEEMKQIQLSKDRIFHVCREQARKRQKIEGLKQQKKQQQQQYGECEFKRKRFEFLIKDQMLKNIPQSMREFIRVAQDMCLFNMKNRKLTKQGMEETAMKLHNFNLFLNQFDFINPYLMKLAYGEEAIMNESQEIKIGDFEGERFKYIQPEQFSVQDDEENKMVQMQIEEDENILKESQMRKKVKPNEDLE